MEEITRKAIERRALELWQAAGAPSGGGLRFWLMAERQLGLLPKMDRHDPFVILSRMAARAHGIPSRPATGRRRTARPRPC
jgi:hypothetical protein